MIGLFIISILVKPNAWKLSFVVLIFPAIISFTISSQYYVGILLVSFFLNTADRIILALIEQREKRTVDLDTIEKHLEKISSMHTQASLMISEMSSYFGFQIFFVVFDSFKYIAVTAFQIFCMIFLHSKRQISFYNYYQVISSDFASMLVLSIELLLNFSICEKCTEYVSCSTI